jgi:tetratricopeptide (TPR) repeat protein
MKQIVILLICIAMSFSVAKAQKGKVYAAKASFEMTPKDLDAAKKSIDPALTDLKSMYWPETFIVAAKVYRELYKNGSDTAGYKKAVNFYLKAIELDAKGDENGKNKGKFQNELFLDITTFKTELTQNGVEKFTKEDYSSAIFAFESILVLENTKVLSENEIIDTAIIYNCGLAAYNANKYDVAEKYLSQAVSYKYGGGDAILLLNQVYVTSKDSVKMGENLTTGFKNYPQDTRILTGLINYYLSAKKNKEALDYLNAAIEQDPANASYYYARGVLYDQSKEFAKAENDYLKCLEFKADYYNSLYNLGVLYYNQGVELHNQANEISDTKKFNEAKKVANSYFEKALPFMERAKSVIEADENARIEDKMDLYNSLKNLYYRFDNIPKYEEIQKIIDNLNK